MSFILQLFRAPSVLTPVEADAYISSQSARVPGNKDRFNAFVREVVAYLPTYGDHDVDDNGILWSEGLSEADADDADFAIGVKTDLITLPLMGVIARAAALSGLQILDPQNGLLYQLDGTVIDLYGGTEPFPTPASLPRHKAKKQQDVLAAATVLEYFHDQFAPALRAAGFAPCIDGETLVLEREHGCTRQQFRIQCSLYERRVQIYADWRLWCDALHSHWQAVFQPAYTERMRFWPANEPDFNYHLSFSPIHHQLSREGLDPTRVASESEMQCYARNLLRWLEGVVEQGLDPARDIVNFGAVMLNETWRKEEFHFTQNYSIRTAANQLVLAALTCPRQIDDWIELARKRFNRYQWRDRLDDIDGKYLDKLIAYAKSLAERSKAAG